MGANSSCSAAKSRDATCCGDCEIILGNHCPVPERRILSKSRRWNRMSRSSASTATRSLIGEQEFEDRSFDDEKVNHIEPDHVSDLVDSVLFDKFGPNTRNTVFGFVRTKFQPLIGDMATNKRGSVPKNVHYLILLYYYSMENEFDGETLDLWHQRAVLSEFMNNTIGITRGRMWDKFDKEGKGLLPTERFLSKFVYTMFVLHLKSQRRKASPPKYAKVKKCTKYMSLLMIQTLPMDQKQYLDKQHFVDHIHDHLAQICWLHRCFVYCSSSISNPGKVFLDSTEYGNLLHHRSSRRPRRRRI